MRAWAAAALLACAAAAAHADEVKVGRYRLVMPEGMKAIGRDFDAGQTGGDVRSKIQGHLLRLTTTAGEPLALLVLHTVRGAGTFQWSASCKDVETDAKTFVHSPLSELNDECLVVTGPYDLDGSLDNMSPAGAKTRDDAAWRQEAAGYIFVAKFAYESGEMLSALAFVPQPFDGLPMSSAPPQNGSQLPDSVVSWGFALLREVKAGVGSWSGRVRVPMITKPTGPTRVARNSLHPNRMTTP